MDKFNIEMELEDPGLKNSKVINGQKILLKQLEELNFSVFINNQFLLKDKSVYLIKKFDNVIIDQKAFQLTGEKLFEGWFKLGE